MAQAAIFAASSAPALQARFFPFSKPYGKMVFLTSASVIFNLRLFMLSGLAPMAQSSTLRSLLSKTRNDNSSGFGVP
jgi:hypothetical protein